MAFYVWLTSSAYGAQLSRGKKRPNMSPGLALTSANSRSSGVDNWQASTTSSGSVQDPSCRPWDRGDLYRRLATFKSMTWFAKPQVYCSCYMFLLCKVIATLKIYITCWKSLCQESHNSLNTTAHKWSFFEFFCIIFSYFVQMFRRYAESETISFHNYQVVSAVNCARRGWINIDMDTIACESCGARLLFSSPSSWTQQQGNQASVP